MKTADDHINEVGLKRFIQSLFPRLKSISFNEIEYDSNLNATDPVNYLTNDVNGKWYFGLGSMAMIFKSFDKNKKNKILNSLLLENNIDKNSSYNLGSVLNKPPKVYPPVSFLTANKSIDFSLNMLFYLRTLLESHNKL